MEGQRESPVFGISACGLGAHKVGIMGMSLGMDTPLPPPGAVRRVWLQGFKSPPSWIIEAPSPSTLAEADDNDAVMTSFSPERCAEARYVVSVLTALLGRRQARNFHLLIGEAANKNLSS